MIRCTLCGQQSSDTNYTRTQKRKASQGKSAKCIPCTTNQGNTDQKNESSSKSSSTTTTTTALSQPGACISIRQPFASLAILGISRVINMHTWRDGIVETIANVIATTKTKSTQSTQSTFTVWIHAAEEKAKENDLSRIQKDYASFCDIHQHWPKKFPTNCIIGRITVNRVLPGTAFNDGLVSFSGESSTIQKEIHSSNLLMIGQAEKLVLPLPIQAPQPSKRCRVWNLPKSIRNSAIQQGTVRVSSVHQSSTSSTNISIVVNNNSSGSSSSTNKNEKEQDKFPVPSEQKASRRCAPEFWRIDTTAMRDPLLEPGKKTTTEVIESDGGSVVVWLRQDLRMHDNPALAYAASLGVPVHVVYIHAEHEEGGWPLMGAAKMWLHHALKDVDTSLRRISCSGSGGLVCLDATHTSSEMMLFEYLLKVGATNLYFNNVCEPWKRTRDLSIKATLRTNGINVQSFKAVVLYEPWDARPDERPECMQIGFGSVGFFRRACSALEPPGEPLPSPTTLYLPKCSYSSTNTSVESLKLLNYPIKSSSTNSKDRYQKCRFCTIKQGLHITCKHSHGQTIDWGVGMRKFWDMTENGALQSLASFLKENNGERMKQFDSNERHRADRKSTSIISPYVRFGQLSPRYIVAAAKEQYGHRVSQTFLRRLVWRDLAYWSLWRFPTLPTVSFRIQYEKQWWSSDKKMLKAWQQGKTGYPLVDAAMRQLWVVGWMPNYMRHVVAGFLIEYLNLHWIHGLKWFHDTLVDSDLAINSYMWQNGGHSGMDRKIYYCSLF